MAQLFKVGDEVFLKGFYISSNGFFASATAEVMAVHPSLLGLLELKLSHNSEKIMVSPTQCSHVDQSKVKGTQVFFDDD